MDRFIRDTIYHAKRDYGKKIAINHRQNEEVDIETGERIQSPLQRIVIRRAAMLPTLYARNAFRGNREQHGGAVDTVDAEFVIDKRDIRGFPAPTASDWIDCDAKRYQILTVEDLSGEGFIIRGRFVGASPEPMDMDASSALAPGASAHDD